MVETLNMMSVNIKTFTREIKADFEDGNYDPVIGIGKSGVGKTMSIYELTQELGIGFCELRLVTLTETDLLGIPTIENGRTTWASNDLLPMAERDGESGILVLDEITSATSTIRAAAYQLLDSKRALGNYKLPPKWKVIGLGNGPSDGGVFSGMESAFLSRATCYRIEPDFGTWKAWAIKNSLNPTVIAFLSSEPSFMHQLDDEDIASIFPCPRSWTALSKKLEAREKRNSGKPLEEDIVRLLAAGAIGEKVSANFSAFYAYNKVTIDIEDILDGKASTNITSLPSEVMHIVISNLVSQLTKLFKTEETKLVKHTKLANACKWLIGVAKYRSEYASMAFQDLSSNCSEIGMIIALDEDFTAMCPELDTFYSENKIIYTPD